MERLRSQAATGVICETRGQLTSRTQKFHVRVAGLVPAQPLRSELGDRSQRLLLAAGSSSGAQVLSLQEHRPPGTDLRPPAPGRASPALVAVSGPEETTSKEQDVSKNEQTMPEKVFK